MLRVGLSPLGTARLQQHGPRYHDSHRSAIPFLSADARGVPSGLHAAATTEFAWPRSVVRSSAAEEKSREHASRGRLSRTQREGGGGEAEHAVPGRLIRQQRRVNQVQDKHKRHVVYRHLFQLTRDA